ncbi:hypothetical protein [Bartonella sp. MM73XJBT.G]|uniref:hypothetical protein n=1 Tax=Bartonella sp. MM73XJBT.G TaxID=3019097 RepID=UPI0023615267|nr:hypothetical protein [Bartonella sp. MM73XJBT.G]
MPCVGFGMGVMEVPVIQPMMINCLAYLLPMDMMGVFYSIVMLAALLERSYKRLEELACWGNKP